MSPVNIDWRAIRPLNGSRAGGFEQLCAQLARAESPAGSCFFRKGAPDAGVECYTTFRDGSEWGWQAKYFYALGAAQWSQLDDSVRTALAKHPGLVRYYVCVPLDRPDARIRRQRSAMDRWVEHVKKWSGWASKHGMTVDFVYWGSHELLERLTRTAHVGLLRFWFDACGFDQPWFTKRLDEALQSAGPRYTPEIHIELPIAADLDAFGRTERFFDNIKMHARNIRKKHQAYGPSGSKFADPTLQASTTSFSGQVHGILAEFGAITNQPIGVLPFQRICKKLSVATNAAEEIENLLIDREREEVGKTAGSGATATTLHRGNNPLRDLRHSISSLAGELQNASEALSHADAVASHALLILKGDAGTGKTHLLCDVARQRILDGQPTVLFMGQRFTSSDDPWKQALQQIDLPGISAEEFVGALESAAQASGCRALVMVDAINEGTGRQIWPSHLPAFLASLARSPWIGVLLSVRSSYEKILIPEEIRTHAFHLTHSGFEEHEYDAMRTYFVHYGLELPSTPLLAPEFRNPLFLKTLCEGLKAKQERRLPRGFHGITAVFDLYLDAINKKLAQALGFNPGDPLVRKSLDAIAQVLAGTEERWLPRGNAEGMVNALLPGREFERSLYRGLVSEGLLIEETVAILDESREEVVLIAYDRLADHLVAKTMLDAHLDKEAPASSFVEGAPLSFLWEEGRYVAPGLIEAMCIQVPELTGHELVSLAPKLSEQWGIADAYRQSIVWRSLDAFSLDTLEVLNSFIFSDRDDYETLDVILTVSTLPGHPFNKLLDRRLRKTPMPDRDAWWSTYLHRAWRTRGAMDRLIDWAYSMTPDITIDNETIDLSAGVLSWMLSTSNRYIRDRATTALVNLLTARVDAVVRLIENFSTVDDPYVTERVYAVAYGTAMRSNDPEILKPLAESVYARVFANGAPPAHILLRDYARGVVERALYLGVDLEIDIKRIRPPYASQWPKIPSEEEIKPLLPDWLSGSQGNRNDIWARHRIGSSVMSDDFARYVIGTNSSRTSSDWMSLKLEDPPWQSPEERLEELVAGFSDTEKEVLEKYSAAADVVQQLSIGKWLAAIQNSTTITRPVLDASSDLGDPSDTEDTEDSAITHAESKRDAALAELEKVLTARHAQDLKVLLAEMDTGSRGKSPPYFELRLIQHYVLWRVFDLGWTTKRFGRFDQYSVGCNGREASKAERIGKKYQWIAYHEILAYMSDHFQFREKYRDKDGDKAYEGPWQIGRRDIDPSCTLRALKGGNSWEGHTPSWWGPTRYKNWDEPSNHQEWARRYDDLPLVEDLLLVSRLDDDSRWVNAEGTFHWEQPHPADRESTDVERRELFYLCTGYLIRTQDADAFMDWAEGVDFWGRWMPHPPENWRMFLGEYGWSPASRYFRQEYFGDGGWTQPDHGCPVKILTAAVEYLRESRGFDCSVDDGFTLRIPACELIDGLGLRWSAVGVDYHDATGRLVAFDPTVHAAGPSALLLREDALKEFFMREELTMVWAVIGEKRVIGAGFDPKYSASLRMSGAYVLRDKGLTGILKCMLGDRMSDDPNIPDKPIAIIRSSN